MEKVAVLMSTYNGEKYIQDQIESILNQKDVDIDLFIRDDGSKDDTPKILKRIAKKTIKVTVLFGNNIGYTASFMQLVNMIQNERHNYSYVAFSDQDDKWLTGKIVRAVHTLEPIDNEVKMYFSSLYFTNEDGKIYGKKSYKRYKISLKSAMLWSSVAGCTMVMSKGLIDKVSIEGVNIPDGVGHDGWIFKCCLALEGGIVYDDQSNILFRRHSDNASSGGGHFYQKLNIIKKRFFEKGVGAATADKMIRNLKNLPADNEFFLKKITNYKSSTRNRFSLVFDPDFSSGRLTVDIFIKFLIVLGRY